MVPHHLIEKNVVKEMEVRTELIVESVIKGDVRPGSRTILLGPFIGWQAEGGPVMSDTSTEMVGDIEDVSKPNLWFLSHRRSWDPADTKEYLCLDTYRGIQPLALREYFQALSSANPSIEISKLLGADHPLVLKRCLKYVAGGVLPWPYDPDDWERYANPEPRKALRVEEAPRVELLLSRSDPHTRGLAAAVLAELSGAKCVPRMRLLLADSDPEVRTVAVGVLARLRDAASCDAICRAVIGIKSGYPGCKLVAALRGWGDERLVPALISFLQNDDYAYRIGDDLGIPALKAQAALRSLTTRTFPLDVQASQHVWEEARKLTGPASRKAFLARALADGPTPLTGRMKTSGHRVYVALTNRSRRPISLSKMPHSIDWQTANGYFSTGHDPITGRGSFVRLAPGQSIRVDLQCLADRVLGVERSETADGRAGAATSARVARAAASGTSVTSRRTTARRTRPERPSKLTLLYARNGHEFGLKGWIGVIEVVPGPVGSAYRKSRSDGRRKPIDRPNRSHTSRIPPEEIVKSEVSVSAQ
jgi:hypothetical protein